MSDSNNRSPASQAVRDRAAHLATDIIGVVVASLTDWVRSDAHTPAPVRRQIEELLLAFADAATRGERRPPTDS